jgi:lipoprotein-anchoring transpeptidase ErfK/SrfK
MKKIALFVLLILFWPIPATNGTLKNKKVLEVCDSQRIIMLKNESGNIIGNWIAAVPKIKPKLPITGRVTEIIIYPEWYPSREARNEAIRRGGSGIPKRVKPKHFLNSMGDAKFIIVFDSRWVSNDMRIHGTNDVERVGKRDTKECICMKNENIFELISMITGLDMNSLKNSRPNTRIRIKNLYYKYTE